MQFFRKMVKKGKKGQNICKFWQKCTKFENNLKKGNLLRATIGCMKQPEHALACQKLYVGARDGICLAMENQLYQKFCGVIKKI